MPLVVVPLQVVTADVLNDAHILILHTVSLTYFQHFEFLTNIKLCILKQRSFMLLIHTWNEYGTQMRLACWCSTPAQMLVSVRLTRVDELGDGAGAGSRLPVEFVQPSVLVAARGGSRPQGSGPRLLPGRAAQPSYSTGQCVCVCACADVIFVSSCCRSLRFARGLLLAFGYAART